jgi:Na+-transporting NADH:ubiquinone oxidoreductase subunit F
MVFAFSILVLVSVFVGLTAVVLAVEQHLVRYGRCTITINGGERVIEQNGGDSLLSILHDHKIFIPAACGGRATCGYCKVSVLAGGGEVLPTEKPFLSHRDIRSGLRLACQLKVRADLDIRVPDEVLHIREYEGRVVESRELTRDIKEIVVDVLDPDGIPHHAGQYIQIFIPDFQGRVFRAYSISSPAHHTRRIRLVVRLVPGGVASVHLHGLTEGEPIHFAGPYGDFRLSEDPTREIVCIGGGCGMAPMVNIVETALVRWPERRLQLFFGCRTPEDVFYLDKFRALTAEHPNFRVVYAVSEPHASDTPWDGETGLIHLVADKHLDPDPHRQAFLCGPPPMIEATVQVLMAKGMSPADIFSDTF